MMNIVLFAQAATAACSGKCPPHAIAALAGVCVISFLVGFFLGRRGKKCGCEKTSSQSARPQRRMDNRRRDNNVDTRQPLAPGCVEIYVGNLSYDLTDDVLRKEFEAFGNVSAARIVTNKFNNRSKGYGFVVMTSRSEADAAIAAMSEKEVLGRKMRVNEARNTIKEEA